MAGRQRDDKRFVVQRAQHQAGFRERQRHDRDVDFALLEQFDQLERVIFLQHQRHLRDALDHLLDQRRQQIRPDRIDHAEPQRPDQRVFALLGDFLDGEGLLENALSLRDDLFSDRRDADFAGAALEDLDVEFVLELLDRHRQGRLANETCLGSPAEVPLAGHRDDVFQFGERHWGTNQCSEFDRF